MRVRVEFFATLREKFGKAVDVTLEEDARLVDVLRKVEGLYEEVVEGGEIKPRYKVLVNGLNVEFLQGLNTEVKDGDEICVFPPAGGG